MEAIINQLFEIEKKATEQNLDIFERNLNRIQHELEELGYKIINPIGNQYDERDASIEANILNPNAKKMLDSIKSDPNFEYLFNDRGELYMIKGNPDEEKLKAFMV